LINSFLKWTYPNAKTIDSIIPINEKVNTRKSLKKKSAIKNKDIIRNRISNICREYFIILNAYAGITFSFQWSLILLFGITKVTFFVTLRIESRYDKKFSLIKTSTDKMQTNDRRR
tara:strand:- start:349 stop:696 length:348 start_codon:yes stop_codon:yes gene_type:complete